MNGKEVILLIRGEASGQRQYPGDLARVLNDDYQGQGVALLLHATVTGVRRQGEGLVAGLRQAPNGRAREIPGAGVVAGLGVKPNVGLARTAGLPVGDGILVNQELRAGHPGLDAAGDLARAADERTALQAMLKELVQATRGGQFTG